MRLARTERVLQHEKPREEAGARQTVDAARPDALGTFYGDSPNPPRYHHHLSHELCAEAETLSEGTAT